MSDKKPHRILGWSTPFEQGGSVRLTLPKRYVKEYDIKGKMKGREFFGLIFVKTDNGVLLVAAEDMLRENSIRDALSFANITKINDEDLKILFEEQE
jgi:hypothetical protein